MPDIDDNELRILRGAHKLLERLQNDPKARGKFQAAVKEIEPSTVTDEDRRKELPEVKQLTELADTVQKFIKRYDEREQDTETRSAFDRLRSDPHNYTDEGIDKIKKLMVDRKIGDPEAAAALFERQNPPAPQPPSGFVPTNWQIGQFDEKDTDTKLLFENEDRWAELEAIKAIHETPK